MKRRTVFFLLRHICEFCSLEQPLPFGRGDLLQISRSRAGEEETNLSSCFSQLGPALNHSQIFKPDCSAGEIPEDWRSQVSLKTYVLYFTEFVSENSENIGVENTTNLSLYHFHGTQVRSLPTLSLSPYQQNQNNATSQLIFLPHGTSRPIPES